ncbi:MAG: ABC transporter permease [Lachnospiraceae bacterium]|nr:ABC transporter permease [Lachnospiraceae bacterium]
MKIYLKKAVRSPGFLLWLFLAVILVMIPVFAPWIAPHDPVATDYANSLNPGCAQYPFGTDQIGRCILSRLIWGGRTSLLIVFQVIAIIAVIGVVLGIFSGYTGGWIDMLLTRFTDIVMAIPSTVFVIALVSVLGPGLHNTVLAMSLVGWTEYFRVARALVLSIRENQFVQEARMGGLTNRRIVRRVILPNIIPYLLVNLTQDIGAQLLTLSGLSLLGLSSQPPTPEWGFMLSEGRKFIQSAPWLIIYPGMVIVLHVIVFNLLGDSLRDILDPRYEKKHAKRKELKQWQQEKASGQV